MNKNLSISLFGISTKAVFLLSTILTLLLYGACSSDVSTETPAPQPPPPSQTYTVTFNTNGGSEVQSREVNSGDTVAKPENPTKADSTFANWFADQALTKIYSFSALVTSDLALYAKWISEDATTYQVVFNTNGGSNVEPQTIVEGKAADEPDDPTREGYRFLNWYSDLNAPSVAYNFTETAVADDITLYANWIKRYTVTFNTNVGGGVARSNTNGTNEIAPEEVDSNATISAPSQAPTREGYRFVYWYSDLNAPEDDYDFDNKVKADITLYANWVKTFTVTFNMNGGTAVGTQTQTIDSGMVVAKPTNPMNEEHGGTFEGWYSNEGLRTEHDNDTVKSNISLYAKWRYMVTYNATTRAITGLVGGDDMANGDVRLVIPSNVNGIMMDSIRVAAFEDNTRIVSLKIAEGIKYIGDSAFYGTAKNAPSVSRIAGDLVIPNSVVTIGNLAFFGCVSFGGSLTLGNSVETIGEWAFDFCTGFTGSLTIPNSVWGIGLGAFNECRGFTGSLTIGNSVVEIGQWAFRNMTSIDTFIFENSTPPPLIGTNIFENITLSELDIRVPNEAGVVGRYKAVANLAQYSTRIRARQ